MVRSLEKQESEGDDMKLLVPAFLFATTFCAAAPSWAADTCSGLDTLTTETAETADLGGGLKQTSWTASSVVTSNDSPFNLLVGVCSSTTLVTPDGKTQSSGFCARHDKDGDTNSISISQEGDKLTWKSLSGTGKYSTSTKNTGWAQPVFSEGKIRIVKWGGDCH
jgi:hypothetical protein